MSWSVEDGVAVAYHPLNLGLRFVLEMVALVIFGLWGWSAGGWLGWMLAALW